MSNKREPMFTQSDIVEYANPSNPCELSDDDMRFVMGALWMLKKYEDLIDQGKLKVVDEVTHNKR